MALLLGEYLSQVLPVHLPAGPKWLAAAAVLGLSAVQFRGLREGSRAQEITAGTVLLGVMGLLVAST